jgi:hypothetical protein
MGGLQDYTMHGLSIHFEGIKRLKKLTAEVAGGHKLGISRIPVITHARASPFLA